MIKSLLTALLAAAPQNLLDSGRRALESGDLVRAEESFRQYLLSHPESAEALSNLGAICARQGQGCRGPCPRSEEWFISCPHTAGQGATAGSWQPASRPAAAGASVGGGSAGPSLEGYGRGLRAGSVQVCWTGCGAGRGGYRAG